MADLAAQILESIPDISQYRWSSTDTSKRFQVENPVTGKVITMIQAGDRETVDLAVQAAQKGFETNWRWKTRQERSVFLYRAADELQKHAEELAILLCLENGKALIDARNTDVLFLFIIFRYFAFIGDKVPFEFLDQGGLYSAIVYEPYGVTVGILLFNWSPVYAGGKMVSALAAGNTMILKPGEQALLIVMRIVEILQSVLSTDMV